VNTGYRFKFSKIGRIRFIGHLDLLKLFQKALRRADLPVAYSEGFNPHMKITFAAPLPLGFESRGEYADIFFKSVPTGESARQKTFGPILNRYFPEGLKILKSIPLEAGEKNCAAVLRAALYVSEAADFLPSDDVYFFRRDGNTFSYVVPTGSARNLKPEVLLTAPVKTARLEMYELKDNKFVSLDKGETIEKTLDRF
jgi:hypothetical protein